MSDNEALRHDVRELEHLLTVATIENERLRAALTEAVDLLLERTYGSPARSAGHNARLVLQAALKSGTSEEAAERTKTIKAAPRRRRVADDEIPF